MALQLTTQLDQSIFFILKPIYLIYILIFFSQPRLSLLIDKFTVF